MKRTIELHDAIRLADAFVQQTRGVSGSPADTRMVKTRDRSQRRRNIWRLTYPASLFGDAGEYIVLVDAETGGVTALPGI